MNTETVGGLGLITVISIICIGIALFYRYPSSLSILGLTVNGIGFVGMPFVGTYAKLNVAIQCFGILLMFLSILRANSWGRLLNYRFSRRTWFLWLLALVWLEVFGVTLYSGLGEFRGAELSTAVLKVFLPLTMLILVSAYRDIANVVQGCLWGMLWYGIAWTIPDMLVALRDGRVFAAILGAERLTLYAIDTINSSQLPFVAATAALLLAVWPHRQLPVRIALIGASIAMIVVVILCGTRQYALAYLGAVTLVAIMRAKRSRAAGLIPPLLISTVVVVSLLDYLSNSEFVERIRTRDIAAEVQGGRGEIWADAFRTAIQHPFLGVGFKNYGLIMESYSMRTQGRSVSLSGAHGFLQEIAAEHGIILFIFALTGVTGIIINGYVYVKKTQVWCIKDYYIICVTLTIPTLFSGSISNALGFYMFALFPVYVVINEERGMARARRTDKLRMQEPDLAGVK